MKCFAWTFITCVLLVTLIAAGGCNEGNDAVSQPLPAPKTGWHGVDTGYQSQEAASEANHAGHR